MGSTLYTLSIAVDQEQYSYSVDQDISDMQSEYQTVIVDCKFQSGMYWIAQPDIQSLAATIGSESGDASRLQQEMTATQQAVSVTRRVAGTESVVMARYPGYRPQNWSAQVRGAVAGPRS